MVLMLKAPVLELGRGEAMTLVDAVGTRIAAQSGTLWVTQEGDRKDHILGEGQAIVVARPGRTVVQAMRHSRVAIHEDPEIANDGH